MNLKFIVLGAVCASDVYAKRQPGGGNGLSNGSKGNGGQKPSWSGPKGNGGQRPAGQQQQGNGQKPPRGEKKEFEWTEDNWNQLKLDHPGVDWDGIEAAYGTGYEPFDNFADLPWEDYFPEKANKPAKGEKKDFEWTDDKWEQLKAENPDVDWDSLEAEFGTGPNPLDNWDDLDWSDYFPEKADGPKGGKSPGNKSPGNKGQGGKGQGGKGQGSGPGQECVIPVMHVHSKKVTESKPTWELRLSYRGKSGGVATTRTPMIEIAAYLGNEVKMETKLRD